MSTVFNLEDRNSYGRRFSGFIQYVRKMILIINCQDCVFPGMVTDLRRRFMEEGHFQRQMNHFCSVLISILPGFALSSRNNRLQDLKFSRAGSGVNNEFLSLL